MRLLTFAVVMALTSACAEAAPRKYARAEMLIEGHLKTFRLIPPGQTSTASKTLKNELERLMVEVGSGSTAWDESQYHAHMSHLVNTYLNLLREHAKSSELIADVSSCIEVTQTTVGSLVQAEGQLLTAFYGLCEKVKAGGPLPAGLREIAEKGRPQMPSRSSPLKNAYLKLVYEVALGGSCLDPVFSDQVRSALSKNMSLGQAFKNAGIRAFGEDNFERSSSHIEACADGDGWLYPIPSESGSPR